MNISLDCGRNVRIDRVELSRTWAGLLVCFPNGGQAQREVERLLKSVLSRAGEIKVHLIPPTIDRMAPTHLQLPRVAVAVWLHSDDPVNPEYHASKLIVIFYCDDIEKQPILSIIQNYIRSIRWDELAEDWIY